MDELDIHELRVQIDKVTLKMVQLFHERRKMAKRIGTIKKSMGKKIKDKKRETHLRSHVLLLSKEIGLEESAACSLLDFLFEESLKIQHASSKKSEIKDEWKKN